MKIDNELTLRRRRQILEAATVIFARYGYRQTDVQYIADKAGIGKGTVYRYFPSKKQLFLSAVDQGMQNLKQKIDSDMEKSKDPFIQLQNAARAYLNFFHDHPEIIELFIQERSEFKDRKMTTYLVYREASLQKWQKLFSKLMEQGKVRQMPVSRIIDVLNSIFYGTIFSAYFTGNPKSGQKQAEEILDIVLNGILHKSAVDPEI